MAGVFAARGHQGLVVHGGDGLDELTTTTTSSVWVYADGRVERAELDPLELDVPRAGLADLVGSDPLSNAQVVREVVAGCRGPVRDIVLLNAAAALVADAKPSLTDCFPPSPTSWRGPGRRGQRSGPGQAGRMGGGDPGGRAERTRSADAQGAQRVQGLARHLAVGVVRHGGGGHDERAVVQPDQQGGQRVVPAGQVLTE